MKIDDSLFAKYQAGECSTEEIALVERWLDQLDRFPEPQDRKMLMLLENLDNKMPFIKKRKKTIQMEVAGCCKYPYFVVNNGLYILEQTG